MHRQLPLTVSDLLVDQVTQTNELNIAQNHLPLVDGVIFYQMPYKFTEGQYVELTRNSIFNVECKDLILLIDLAYQNSEGVAQ